MVVALMIIMHPPNEIWSKSSAGATAEESIYAIHLQRRVQCTTYSSDLRLSKKLKTHEQLASSSSSAHLRLNLSSAQALNEPNPSLATSLRALSSRAQASHEPNEVCNFFLLYMISATPLGLIIFVVLKKCEVKL